MIFNVSGGLPESPISLSVAKKRIPKEGRSYWITPVRWGTYKFKVQKVIFESLGKEFDLAIAPELPAGYKMESHSTWDVANTALLEAAKVTQDFEKLLVIIKDCEKLAEALGKFNIIHPYDLADFKPPEGFNDWWSLQNENRNLSKTTLFDVIDSLPESFHFQDMVVAVLNDGTRIEVIHTSPIPLPEELKKIPLSEVKSVELSIRCQLDKWRKEYYY